MDSAFVLAGIVICGLIGLGLWVALDPHFHSHRRKPSAYTMNLWTVPNMTGQALSFSDIVGSSVGSNGVYDRFTHQWSKQETPRVGDIVVCLFMCSMGVTVRQDHRGRVDKVEWCPGWNQPAVEVRVKVEGISTPQTLRFPLSETYRMAAHRHHWITVQ